MSFQFQTICMTFMYCKNHHGRQASFVMMTDLTYCRTCPCEGGRSTSLQWRHNGRDCVSIQQPRDCLLNCLFRLRSKKTSKLRVTGLCVGNSPGPVNSPHKWPVTRKIWWRHQVQVRSLCYLFNRYPSIYITSLGRYWYYWTWLENAQQVKWPYTCSPVPL